MMVKLTRSWMVVAVVAMAMVVLGCVSLPARADISHGYPAEGSVTPGTIVALSADGSGSVVPATQALINRVIGVVVAGGTITLGAANEVQVATDGAATVLVSTADGDIKRGDYITMSPVQGVGMKASASGRVVGVAQDDFSATTAGAESVPLKDGSVTRQIAVGQIPLEVGVTTYNVASTAVSAQNAVQHFASTFVGKPVKTARLYIALVIIIAALLSSVVLLYAGVRSSIVAVGRNPLARSAITGSLLRIIGVVVLILAVASGATWMVLR